MLRLFCALVAVCISAAAQVPSALPSLTKVPAGSFEMGSSAGHAWEKPAHPVAVPAYEISARPVSNAEFRVFRPAHRSPRNDEDSFPVTGVTWHDAAEYCAWLSEKTGRRFQLPSEAWWERAVRGGLNQKDYPWGDEPPSSSREDSSANPSPNAYGVSAVGYNLWEWTADWYASDYYSSSPADDPRGPEQGDFKVLRGGGYRDDPDSATTYTRGSARPDTRSEHITFRVAVGPGGPAPRPQQPKPPVEVTRAEPTPRKSAPTPSARPQPRAAQPKSAQAQAKPTQPPPAPPQPTPSPAPAASLEITDIAITFPAAGPEIHLAVSGQARVRSFALDNPARQVFDIRGAKIATGRLVGEIAAGQGGIERVRYSQFQLDPPIARIVVDTDRIRKHQTEATADAVIIRLEP